MSRQLNVRGQATRNVTLNKAVQLASNYGLEGLTIGVLSNELRMSKSGLIGLFGSKEQLQLAVLQRAVDIFLEAVIAPIQSLPYGMERFHKLVDGWLSYVENDVFEGGCFFIATASEFDSRPGAVRDELVNAVSFGVDYLEDEAMKCLVGDKSFENTIIKQLVFEVHSMILGVNLRYKLLQDRNVFDCARLAIANKIEAFEKEFTNMEG